MFPLSLALLSACGPFVEKIETNKALELNLQVIEAFEHGPVVIEVSITNRGTKPLLLEELSDTGFHLLSLPAGWMVESRHPRPRCPLLGWYMPLGVGQTFTQRRVLHREYISVFPAGTYQIGVMWVVHASGKRKWEGNPLRQDVGLCLVTPAKTFPVTVSRDTPANGYALATRLEAEFAALPVATDADGESDSPFGKLCERVIFAPHKELIPLALKLLDRERGASRKTRRWLPTQLVETIFDSDPATAQRVFVDRLLASPPQIAPNDVFFAWMKPNNRLSRIQARLCVIAEPQYWLDSDFRRCRYWTPIEDALEFVPWVNDLAPHILPDAELRRLVGAKDLWVRAWMYRTFTDRLGPEWCAAFLKEARKWAEAVPDPKQPNELAPSTAELIRILWPTEEANRKLLEAFAAGAADNPVAKAARAKLAEVLPEK